MNNDAKMLAEAYGLIHDASRDVRPGKKVKFIDPVTKKEITGIVSSRTPQQIKPEEKFEPNDVVISSGNSEYIMPKHELTVL